MQDDTTSYSPYTDTSPYTISDLHPKEYIKKLVGLFKEESEKEGFLKLITRDHSTDALHYITQYGVDFGTDEPIVTEHLFKSGTVEIIYDEDTHITMFPTFEEMLGWWKDNFGI